MPARTDIRNAVKTILEAIAGITTVYIGRHRAIPPETLPAACVYINREDRELETIGSPREFARRLEMVTEIHAQANDTKALEELLDTLCAARETAILADETLGGLVETIEPESDEYTLEEEATRPAGVAICRDQILYTA